MSILEDICYFTANPQSWCYFSFSVWGVRFSSFTAHLVQFNWTTTSNHQLNLIVPKCHIRLNDVSPQVWYFSYTQKMWKRLKLWQSVIWNTLIRHFYCESFAKATREKNETPQLNLITFRAFMMRISILMFIFILIRFEDCSFAIAQYITVSYTQQQLKWTKLNKNNTNNNARNEYIALLRIKTQIIQ